MFTQVNLVGKKFGKVKIIKFLYSNNKKGRVWKCKCDCGNFVEKSTVNLKSPNAKVVSCGCVDLRGGHNKAQLLGKKFNAWKVLKLDKINKHGKALWKCQCRCGYIGFLESSTLVNGYSKSCGCSDVEDIELEKEYIKFIKKNKRFPTIKEVNKLDEFTFTWWTRKKRIPITEFLKKYKIKVKAGGRWYFNENYFEKIDKPDKAYFLGLLATDGSIMGNSFRLALQIKDKHILNTFKKYIKTKRPLQFLKKRDKNHQDQFILSCGSKKIAQDLKKYGIIRNKTFITTFPHKRLIPKNLIRHFLRGIFDGDGSINRTSGIMNIVSASKKFLRNLAKVILINYGLQSKIISVHPTTESLYVQSSFVKDGYRYRRGNTRILFNLFYKNTPKDLFFKRKYKIFKNAIRTGKTKAVTKVNI